MKNYLISLAVLSVALLTVSGCGNSEGAVGNSAAKKKLYWIQGMKGHPVHQLTQIGFNEGCKKLGYEMVVVGADTDDLNATLQLADQALANGDAAGFAIWANSPGYNPFIERASAKHIPVVIPHFPSPEGSIPGVTGVISCDPAEYAEKAALEIGKLMSGKGTVAVTQGGFNPTENRVAEIFRKSMSEKYPEVKVLPTELEGFDLGAASTKAASILQANPGLTAALSTTGGGASAWAQALRDSGRKMVVVGMDYTRINLDLVKNGDVYAVIGQPLWDESFGAAELLDKATRGEKIPAWTRLEAPLITKDNLEPFQKLMDKVEAAVRR